MTSQVLLAGRMVVVSGALALVCGAAASAYAETSQAVAAGAGTTVRLMYASFDPLAGLPLVPKQLRAAPSNELYLVQFVGTPLDAHRAQITAMGGVVERFLTDNTHIIRMPAGTRAAAAKLDYVRWIGAFEPAYRMDEETRAQVLADDGVARQYEIDTMRAGMEQQQALADLIVTIGGAVHTVTPDQFRMVVTLTPQQLLMLANRNEVGAIGVWAPGGPDMNLIRLTGGAMPTVGNAGFLGQGVRGEAHDDGVLMTHQQWNGQAPLIHGTNGFGSHGTPVFGINFATGTGNATITGMLPMREQGIATRAADNTQFGGPTSRLTLNTQAVDPSGPYRSTFQTSSFGGARVTTYTATSRETDDYLFKVDYLSMQSQSNSGNRDSRPQAWSKNIVSVGGLTLGESTSFADDAWATGASIGPSADLRVKPDLSHSFGGILTTSNSGTNVGTTQFSGTSGATPITAGHMGLLIQMWHEGVWQGHGGGANVFLSRPRSATTKAIAINTAHRHTWNQGAMVRARVGWGMIHVGNAYSLRDASFIVDESDVLIHGQTQTYVVDVVAGQPEFKATMVYSDPPGTVGAAQARINDLTLRVTDPNGTIYFGNNGMVATSAVVGTVGHVAGSHTTTPGGAANTVDTVENVFVQNPAAGLWTVEVMASQIVQDARLETVGVTDADFALVVTGATLPVGNPCYANCDGSTAEPILNVADFTCFLQRFAAGESYANCDESTTVPVLNVADFTCFLQTFAAGCP